MKKVFYAVSSLLIGLSLGCGSEAQAQAPYRDFTLTPATVAGLCRGRVENPVDIIINETHGGIGSIYWPEIRCQG